VNLHIADNSGWSQQILRAGDGHQLFKGARGGRPEARSPVAAKKKENKMLENKIIIEGAQPETVPTVPSHPTRYKLTGEVACDYWCESYMTGKGGIVGMVCESCGKTKLICMACLMAGRRSMHECGKSLVN
jgi:hypothetical protein